jgi:hypothetical protein
MLLMILLVMLVSLISAVVVTVYLLQTAYKSAMEKRLLPAIGWIIAIPVVWFVAINVFLVAGFSTFVN